MQTLPKPPSARSSKWKAILIVLVVMLIISFFLPKTPTAAATDNAVSSTDSSAREKDKYEAAFSAWDGSHRNLVKYMKENMNDPESFEHVKTSYWKWGKDSVVVRMRFRGKNAFGGVVTQNVRATASIDGKLGTVKFEE